MADDPLGDLFGPKAASYDPLEDVFGGQPNPEWSRNPLTQPHKPTDIGAALQGKSVREVEQDQAGADALNAALDPNRFDAPDPWQARRIGRAEEREAADAERKAAEHKAEDARDVANAPWFLRGVAKLGLGLEHGWEGTLAYMRGARADANLGSGLGTVEDYETSRKSRLESDFQNASAPEGSLAWFGNAVGNIGGSLWSSGKQALKGAAVGAGVGAVGGSAVGGVGAIPGAVSGGVTGFGYGFLADSFRTNAGSIYGDLKQIKDPMSGEEAVSDEAAVPSAIVGGTIMAVLDTVSLKVLTGPITRPIRAKLTQEIAEEIVAQTRRDAIKAGAIEYLKGVGTETATETLQQITQDVSEDIAKSTSPSDLKTLFNDDKRRREVVSNAVNTALVTAAGMSVIALPGAAGHGARSYQPGAVDDQTQQDTAEPANMPTLDAVTEQVNPGGPKPSEQFGNVLGAARTPSRPVEGRQYNQADAIAELGMTAEEAQQFVTTGKDPRANLAEVGFTPGITADDESSPIPTSIIVAGKDLLSTALGGQKSEGGHLPSDIIEGLMKRGIPEHVARAAAAGVVAESGNREGAVNDTSGATGLGQWLGSRKEALFRKFGPNPTRAQQITHLADELLGEDAGGAAVLAAPDEQSALNAYITKFMRPAKGAETSGDLTRGREALGSGPDGSVLPGQEGSAPEAPRRPTAQIELGEDATDEDIKPESLIDVTQNGETVQGKVEEVYGEGPTKGARIKLKDGTTFDEVLSRAREYGARFTKPVEGVKAPVASSESSPSVAVPEGAQPRSYAGEKIDDEHTAFHPDMQSLGLPRAEMPQIKQVDRGAFVNFLEARGVTATEEEVQPGDLKPTQAEFQPAKVAAFAPRGDGRRILVSSDGYVLDGHHQWLATMDKGEPLPVIRLSAPIKELLPLAHEFPSSRTSEGAPGIIHMPGLTGRSYMTAQVRRTNDGQTQVSVDYEVGGVSGGSQGFTAPTVKEAWRKAAAHFEESYSDRRMGSTFTEAHRKSARKMVNWLKIQAGRTGSTLGEPTIQPDLLEEGRGKTLDQLDAKRLAPKVLARMREEEKLDRLHDAIAYVLNRSNTHGDSVQAAKELGDLIGQKLTEQEAYSLARELSDRGAYDVTDDGPPSDADLEKRIDEKASFRPPTKPEPKAKTDEEERADTALDYNTTDRHERVQWMKDAGVTKALLPGGPEKNSATPFGELPKHVQTLLHVYKRDGVQKRTGTAPEHAAVGVDDRELGQIVEEFGKAEDSMEKISHIFDEPGAGILRLGAKTKAFVQDNGGFMTPAEAKAEIEKWKAHAAAQGADPEMRRLNGDKVVLSFFDLSGEWSKPWEEAGYEVHRFDIQDDPEVGDVNNFSTEFFNDWFSSFDGKDIYAILAACPCTDFASSGARHFAAKDADGRTVASVKLVHQTLAAIEYFKPQIWALENPVGRIQKLGGLPHWRLSFDPNDVGDTYTKKTLLWGRFNANLPVAPVEPTEGSKMWSQYGGKSMATKNARSVTPEGFSYSFFMANNQGDNPEMAVANKYDRLDQSLIRQAVKAGITEQQIDEAVEDHYYQDLDDEAANDAIRGLIERGAEPVADQPTEAPINEASAQAIIDKAAPHQDELAAFGKDFPEFINPGMKSAARIIEKVQKEGYESASELKDIVRAGFKVESQTRGEGIAAQIKAKFNVVTDKGWRMVDGDYFDRKLVIEWPDGTKAEIQIIPDALESFRHEGGGSDLYTRWRSIEPGAEKDALLKQMQDGYAKAAEGTSWANLFNSLKSASGNEDLAAAVVNGEPSLVASPGAGTQRLADDQTSAQGLPLTEPEATSRSSTSKNENSLTDSNVGDEGRVGNTYGATNTIFTKDAADKARELIRNKLRTQLNSGFDPELAMAGMQLAGFHIEAGARKFAALAKAIADDLGVELASLKPYIAAWYNGARDLLEGQGEDISDMDGAGAVRAAVTMIPEARVSAPENGNGATDVATDTGTEAPDRGSDAGESARDVSGTDLERGTGPSPVGEGEASDGLVRTGEEPGVGASAVEQPGTDGLGRGERDATGNERSSAGSAKSSRRVRQPAGNTGANFRPQPGSLKREGGWVATANRNLDIIELINTLEAENRPATPQEQELLSKWTGWGAGEIRNKLFGSVDRRTMTINAPYYSGEWQKTIERARELIKGDDLETALQSVQYAHYTSESVVRGMWDAMERFGFQGGRILEPGMGIGHFFTMAPDQIADHSNYTGIEFDAFTAKIAKYLLPEENVIAGDFTKLAFPDGFFDVAIGNPPFSSTKVLNDPAYKRERLNLHNYFFAKSLDKIRPGGILAFVTSRYTMDALDPKARQFMADRAVFVGAIRLPNTAFKENAGTEVTTDIIFLQRRTPGVEQTGPDWLQTEQVTVDGTKFAVNQYFAKNPQMMLGKLSSKGSKLYARQDITLEPYSSKGSFEKQFAEAVSKLPESIYTAAPRQAKELAAAKTFERDFAPASSKEGGVYIKDGKPHVVDRGSGVPVEAVFDTVKPADHAWLKSYVKLRDALKEAQKAQLQDAPDWEAKLNALRKEYKAFTAKHGRVMDFTTYERTTKDEDGETQTVAYRRFKYDRLLFDIEAPLVQSLERITDQGEIEDGPFLSGRTLNKPVRPKIESVDDAMAVTLDEIGRLDLGYVAKLFGQSEDKVVQLLGDRIFQTPAGEWQTADEYLSGNVLQKLEEAQEAAKTAPELQRNVKALLEVQPKPLSYDRIAVKIGAPWIGPEVIQQFADEVLGEGAVPISYDRTTAHWNVEGSKSRFRRNITAEYGTDDRSALELLESLLNNRTIKVTRTEVHDGSKKTVTDPNATAAAQEAAKKIEQRFKTWLWEDAKRTAEHVEIYNRSYNNIAPRRFNGDHLTLPGLSALFKPHPHVKRAVWRVIQTGNTYLAHAVGAGKTAEQIISGMEQRRLGLIKKPMYVVPNHMLKQFSQEFLQLYPAANIMVADERAFHTGNRRRFLAQAALNDPDAIIVTHSSFGKIDTSPEMRAQIVDNMVAELEDAMQDAKDAGEARHLVSRIEKQIEALKRRFEGKTGTGKDKLLTFDEMGVDFLYVDEAHEFRKLDFATNRVAKGIDSAGSARALDLFIKSQWLEKNNPGRSMVLASGTPVTNTMAELYTVMRYMALKDLEKDGISAFDAWANMFGEVAPGYERNAAGGYEIVERFSKFVNVPELMKRVRNFMDVLTSNELGDLVKRPKINGGGPANIIAPQSDALENYMKLDLEDRLKKSREWKPSKEQPGNPDPVINIITDARLASIDMRFVSRGRKADPNSKLNQMIAKIAESYHAHNGLTYTNKDGTRQPRKGAAHIVFSPVGFGEQVALNRGFDVREWIDSELVRLGVKKSEIGWMSDMNTHAKKEQLQKDVRSGKVKVLLGSPKNMGTGLNVQDRLKTLHYLAPPWYPADVTQPHGRIERQGNQNDNVDIYWYATEGTYDSTGWGMVARKQKFIDDAMSGDDSVRTLEDISEANMFEMAAALAAGDDRVIRIAELGGEVERLTRLKGAHADTQRTLRSDINTLENFEIPRLKEEQAALQKAQEARGAPYQPFSMTVDGQTYEKHGEAGDALKAAIQNVIDNNVAIPERTEIGKLYGKFPVTLIAKRRGLGLQVEVGGTPLNVGETFDEAKDFDSVGLSRRFETAVQRITADLQDTGRRIQGLQAQLDASKRKYGAPFAEEGQLAEAIAEQNRLQSEMAAETAAKQNPAPSAQVMARAIDESEILTRKRPVFAEEMEKQLRQIMPDDRVGFRVADSLRMDDGSFAGGLYYPWQKMIYLSVESQHPGWTVAHESVHAMRNLGLFTDAEWKRLSDFAWDDPNERERITRDWGHLNLTEDQLKEEAVAELFGQYWHDTESGKGSTAAKLAFRLAMRALRFIATVGRAVAKIVGKKKLETAFEVTGGAMKTLEEMRAGHIGSRPTGYGNAEARFAQQPIPDRAPVAHNTDASWTPGRIIRLLRQYAVDHNPTKTKSYVAWIRPSQFIELTTPAQGERELRDSAGALDREQLTKEAQTPFLIVEEAEHLSDARSTGFKVVGHEGRHRMAALEAEGVERVPVVITRRDIEWSNLEPIDRGYFAAQSYGGGARGSAGAFLRDLMPLTYANEAQIAAQFGQPGLVQFSAQGNEAAQVRTREQFRQRYLQHIDIRGRDGSASERLASVQRDGWKAGFGPNLTPVSNGRAANIMEERYLPKAGDVVYLVPPEGREEGGNGARIRSGWKPGPGEAVTIQRDGQDPYELFAAANGPRFSVAGNVTPASPDFGGQTEERWKEAKKGIGSGPGMIANAKAWWEDLTGGFTRHWRALPNTARFADVGQQLRKLEAAPEAAMAESIRYLRGLVKDMSAEEYDLFSRKIVLDDLTWDAGEGRDLPFGFTPSTLKAARQNVDAQMNLNPKLIRKLRERKDYNQRITEQMVEAGVLTRDQVKNPAYFRHMVLDYARHEAALARSPNKVKSPYWAKRMGSSLDINANLLEAELDWLQKAQIDTTTAKTIDWIKNSPHNIREQLRSQARADNKAALDQIIRSNPAAKKEDGWFRSNIARGIKDVKDALDAGLIQVPAHLRQQARDLQNDNRNGERPFALFAYILDNNLEGAMGAGMVLKYSGLRKQWARKMLGDRWIDADDVKALVAHYKPEGMVAWQPTEGRHLFTAKTISESALDMFVGKLADTATPGIDRDELSRALGSVRQQLVVGNDRYTMVLPQELGATLDEFGDRRGEGMVGRVFSGIQSAWKRWVLINPRRFLKYNLNNQTGDLDAMIAGNPGALRKVAAAWKMLRDAGKGTASDRYSEALERGVFTAGLSVNEIPDINQFSEFRHLTDQSKRPDKLLVRSVGKLWRVLQDTTQFRENLFRLAAYLDYVEKIESGKPQLQIGYGASVPQIVDAVSDPKDRAALLARDLIGDYGSISVAGSWLRRYLIPFWSWTEINTRRYWRLTANAYTTSKARGIATGGILGGTVALRTAVGLYARMGMVYGLLWLWNHILFPDDEDKLKEVQKAQLHLILGHDSDGNVITLRTQGALSDVLSTLGFADAMSALNKWYDGQGSLGSVVTDMAKAPVNRVATSVTPIIGEPVEQMLGQELWPDIFNPRIIHDRWRHLFQTVNLENEYDAVAEKPSRGYARSWTESLVYKRNPGEMAYDESRTIAYDWLERVKGQEGGSSVSARGEALRDYRMALRYGDQDAAEKALQEYADLGGTKKSLKQAIKRAHPLGPIAKKDRQAFLDSLTDEQLDTFAQAEEYWRETYVDGGE